MKTFACEISFPSSSSTLISTGATPSDFCNLFKLILSNVVDYAGNCVLEIVRLLKVGRVAAPLFGVDVENEFVVSYEGPPRQLPLAYPGFHLVNVQVRAVREIPEFALT